MLNKYFFIVGSSGHCEYRVKASDIAPFIPELIRSGMMRDIESQNRWGDYQSIKPYWIRVYMDSYQLRNWLRDRNIEVIRDNATVDNSIIYENEPEYNDNLENISERVIYL